MNSISYITLVLNGVQLDNYTVILKIFIPELVKSNLNNPATRSILPS